MRRFSLIFLVIVFVGCTHNVVPSATNEEKIREYSATAVLLSDFSMKIVGHYHSQNLTIPKDFDTKQFFSLLEKIYPDQLSVKHVQNNYRVFVRPLDDGYSVMLCDPKTDRKIMEDFSCHVNRVEIRLWENNVPAPCVCEGNWKQFCE